MASTVGGTFFLKIPSYNFSDLTALLMKGSTTWEVGAVKEAVSKSFGDLFSHLLTCGRWLRRIRNRTSHLDDKARCKEIGYLLPKSRSERVPGFPAANVEVPGSRSHHSQPRYHPRGWSCIYHQPCWCYGTSGRRFSPGTGIYINLLLSHLV